MSAHQMLCHLCDSYRSVIGERKVSSRKHWIPGPILKWLVLDAPMKWPQNMPTRPENHQFIPRKGYPQDALFAEKRSGGTPPTDFENDRAKLLATMERFCSAPDSVRGPRPVLGALTHEQWLKWGYRHADHHLRQFGA